MLRENIQEGWLIRDCATLTRPEQVTLPRSDHGGAMLPGIKYSPTTVLFFGN